jgi:hypothetical protein
MGPITLFDKSFLQSLSLDEAVWFDNFFLTNISPLFFVETLADLEKAIRAGRTPEEEVGIIAHKTPEMHASPSVFHVDLCIANLMGREIPMDGRIVVAGGEPLKTADKKGVLIKLSPEIEALFRWQNGEFLIVERYFAKKWRQIVAGLSFDKYVSLPSSLGIDIGSCKSLEEAKNIADSFIEDNKSLTDFIDLFILLFNLPSGLIANIFQRWLNTPTPSLKSFAPYAAYILSIEIFFSIALATNQISQKKLTNKIDLSYLFYLPFCMIFVSSDHFHRRCTPLFLRDNQIFVWGKDLKNDLRKINKFYDKIPESDRQKGIYSIAVCPPIAEDFLTARLWDRFFPNWRTHKPSFTPKKDSNLVREIEDFARAEFSLEARESYEFSDPDAMIIERRVRKKKGKWWLVPKDLENGK